MNNLIEYAAMVIAAASAASAALPQTGPAWWVTVRKVIDFLAINFGHATNANMVPGPLVKG